MNDPWTLDSVMKMREEIGTGAESIQAERDERFHGPAALVTSFCLDPAIHVGAAAACLVEDSRMVNVGGGSRWRLKNQVRKRILSQLKSLDALRSALQANPERPDDPVQRVIDACLVGLPEPLESQSPEELSATLQVVDWFGETDLKDRLPTVEEVRTRVEYAAFLQPLRSLVGTHFRGRKVELAALGTYVSAPGEVADLRERPPVLIFGPGGMGKSTLVAKFILDHLDQFPILYLDCDRPGLVAEEPITLLAEAVFQLGLQFPDFHLTAQKLRSRWLQEMAAAHEATRKGQSATTHGRVQMMKDFQVFVNELGLHDRRVLLVFDTFEEIYSRSRAFVQEIFQFLNELQALLPNLRTVLAGRHPIPDFKWEPLEIGELDQEAAQSFLEALGVSSAPLRKRLAALLNGNPLSLRLAANVARVGAAGDLKELEKLTDDTEIQGILYRRILGHVRQEVRQIAHPGLILRRITADLIRHVLAVPCGMPEPDEKQALALFEHLQNELSLVLPEGDGVRHRSDVRRVMLRPLRQDRPEQVREIEESAIAFYEPASDVVSRAEEIYHRLSLGQPVEQIEPRWLTGIEESLRSAVEELEGPARAYLASRLRIELYDEDWDNVDQTTWEMHTANRAEDLLRLDRPLEALRALRRRSTRLPGSRLHWFEAQALRRNGQTLESREIARRALGQLLESPDWWHGENPDGGNLPLIAEPLMEWFAGPELASAPALADVRIRIEYFQLLQPYRAMVRWDFAGRERELETLRSYVTGGKPVTSLSERPPLLVHGPGGVGKSTLVAKFALNHLGRFPFVQLDCAELEHSGMTTVSLLAEVARQLTLHFPASYAAIHERIDAWICETSPDAAVRMALRDFRSFTAQWELQDRPVLLFVDNFEDLKSRYQDAYGFLNQLQEILPQTRAVVVGRFDVPELPFERMAIGVLDREATHSFLAASGITSPEIRTKLADLFGGNPLTLRLAVELIHREGPAAIAQLEAMPDASLAPEFLVRRIMDHVPDPRLRLLVRAGMLLRQVTPDLIREVLAKPCGLGPIPEVAAIEMFEALGAPSVLFDREGEVLRPRASIRRLMLGPIRRDSGEMAAAINEAAVRFYQAQTCLTARAEEIYHRLALGQPPATMDVRWIPGVEESLRDAVEELEGPSRLYLASRLGISLSDADWKDADQVTWENLVARRAKELQSLARRDEALKLLRERSTRLPHSLLFALEAELLFDGGRYREALSTARTGLELWPNDPALPALISRCEGALGGVEAVNRALDGVPNAGRAVAQYFSLGNFDREQLAAVIRDALPNSTDVWNVLRSMHVDPSTVASKGVEDIIRWATTGNRIDEFLTATAAYNPSSAALGDFLKRFASQVSQADADPLAAVRLPGGGLFLNRQILRSFLRGLMDVSPRQRILLVNGPPGSGKSHTAHFVAHVSRTTKRFEVISIQGPETLKLQEFVRTIYENAGWRWEAGVQEMTTAERAVQRYANAIQARARESTGRKLLMVQIQPDSDPAVVDFLGELAAADELGMPLILMDFPVPLPPAAQIHTATETLGDLTHGDILDGINTLMRDGQLPKSVEATQLADWLVAHARGGEGFNRRLSGAFREILQKSAVLDM